MKSRYFIEYLGTLYIAFTFSEEYELNYQIRIIIHFA